MSVPATTQARITLKRRENEAWVLARNAVSGEKTVAIGRVVLLVLLFTSQTVSNFVLGEVRTPDFWRTVLLFSYLSFALLSMGAVLAANPSKVIRARTAILVAMPLIDFGFALGMNVRVFQLTHESAAQRLAPFLAVMLATSVLRET